MLGTRERGVAFRVRLRLEFTIRATSGQGEFRLESGVYREDPSSLTVSGPSRGGHLTLMSIQIAREKPSPSASSSQAHNQFIDS